MCSRFRGAVFAAALIAGLLPIGTVVADVPVVIAVIVPANSRLRDIDVESLALIYRRKKLLWDSGRRVVPVNLPADHPLRQRFSRAVLGASPESLEDYWNQQYFQGLLPPHVLASDTAVLRFVGATSDAVGYLPLCDLDDSVRAVLLIDADGLIHAPGEVQDPSCLPAP